MRVSDPFFSFLPYSPFSSFAADKSQPVFRHKTELVDVGVGIHVALTFLFVAARDIVFTLHLFAARASSIVLHCSLCGHCAALFAVWKLGCILRCLGM
jgi:hypothetical protein